jgi:hypothetical protein
LHEILQDSIQDDFIASTAALIHVLDIIRANRPVIIIWNKQDKLFIYTCIWNTERSGRVKYKTILVAVFVTADSIDASCIHLRTMTGGKELSNPGESGSSTQYSIGLFQEVPLPQHSYSQHPRTGHCSPLSPLKMPRLLVIVSCPPCEVFTSKRSNTTAKPPTGLKATNLIVFFCAGKVNQAVLVLTLP